ncbi:MAG: class I SAM-dependent methyltransferase [Candidatus Pacearchaeota archaeon]|jgi:16S rRNA A1518/A1519 N6-dimethyltransferase RsmA/KsgA/DIM1 with predicted DNA glycosylase/AP lyase activity|nr:hypothetical protein [Clostridia bacterium]
MPQSYGSYKKQVKEYLIDTFEKNNITKILDVGPGKGTYAKLLAPYKLDACEVFEKYIIKYKLSEIYNKVTHSNIVDFDFSEYEFLIFGDILEHLTIEDATRIIDEMNSKGQKCLVAVPYSYVQGIAYGNTHEIHIQDDLTIENMTERYPSLKLIYGNKKYGYYVNF